MTVHDIEWRMPVIGEIFQLLLPRPLRTPARMQVLGPAEIKRTVRRVDGRECDIAMARAIHEDRRAFAQYAVERTRWLEAASGAGKLWAECPHCRSWRADLTPLTYAHGLRTEFHPISDDDGYLTLPSLADRAPRVDRPAGIALTSGLEFAGGAFHIGDTKEREDRAWREWAPADTPRPEGREQWRDDVPGFRAIVRLAAALDRLEGSAELPSPEAVMRLSLADFLFLDNIHYLAHDVQVPEDHGLLIQCATCGTPFLPLL